MRRVRLTEGQLHNVIRESVNKILNEIDWKTYNNAALKKSNTMQNPDDIDEYERDVRPLYQASYDTLMRKYPHASSASHKQLINAPLTPEEQEELDAYNEDVRNYDAGRYKYEKGGRGYYV